MSLLVTAISLLLLPSAGAQELYLSFLDVGYGDAIVVRQGDSTALIDTGYPQQGETLFSWLEEKGIEKLDYLLITHPHADHLGNASLASRRLQVGAVGDNGENINRTSVNLTGEMIADYEKAIRQHPSYFLLSRGREFKLGEARITVLWPPEDDRSEDWNTNSAVMLLTWGNFRALLAADCNFAGEEKLLLSGTPLQAELLKVGHHGAADAASSDFLRAVKPRWAVVSVGDNPWGTPSDTTIERLRVAGAWVFLTPRDGDITFRIFADGKVWAYTNQWGPLIFSAGAETRNQQGR